MTPASNAGNFFATLQPKQLLRRHVLSCMPSTSHWSNLHPTVLPWSYMIIPQFYWEYLRIMKYGPQLWINKWLLPNSTPMDCPWGGVTVLFWSNRGDVKISLRLQQKHFRPIGSSSIFIIFWFMNQHESMLTWINVDISWETLAEWNLCPCVLGIETPEAPLWAWEVNWLTASLVIGQWKRNKKAQYSMLQYICSVDTIKSYQITSIDNRTGSILSWTGQLTFSHLWKINGQQGHVGFLDLKVGTLAYSAFRLLRVQPQDLRSSQSFHSKYSSSPYRKHIETPSQSHGKSMKVHWFVHKFHEFRGAQATNTAPDIVLRLGWHRCLGCIRTPEDTGLDANTRRFRTENILY